MNLTVVFTLCRDVGAYMLTRRPNHPGQGGSIIHVAPLVSFQGGLTVPAYAVYSVHHWKGSVTLEFQWLLH